MIAAQVVAKATRDALFLGRYEARHLPIAMLLGVAGSMLAVLAFGRLMSKHGPQAVVPVAFASSAAAFGLEWLLSPVYPAVTIWLLYVHLATLGGAAISGFWSMYSECFDPATAKRLINRVGAAASAGGLLGALAAGRFAAWVDVPAMLLLLVVMNLATAVGARRLARSTPAKHHPQATDHSALAALRSSGYLKQLALLVTLTGLGGALIDFAFKAQADAELGDQTKLLRFFAAFYAVTSVLTFIAQLALTKRLLARLGIAATIALSPAGVLLFSVLGAAVTRLWALALLRGVAGVVGHAMYRPGYELLYTPVAREKKRPTKSLIDVTFARVGDALGGVAVLTFAFALPALAPKIAVVAAAVVGSAGLVVAWRLHGSYVGALVESLRRRTVTLENDELADATTRRTLADTTTMLDRDRLLEEIEEFRRGQDPAPEAGLARAVGILASDDADAINDFLGDDSNLGPEVVPLILPLLAGEQSREAARGALHKLGPRVVGQLHDALLDPSQPQAVRQRLPRVLAAHPHRRSADALVDGLSVDRPELRFRCARGLAQIAAAKPGVVRIDESKIHQLVLEELASASGPPGSDAARRELEHLFALLSLVYDAHEMRLCLGALDAQDAALRGTALEYLDSVLPPDLKAAVWAHLHVERRHRPPRRAHKEVREELLASTHGLVIDPALLRRPPLPGSDK